MANGFINPITSIFEGSSGPDLCLDFNIPDFGDDRVIASPRLLDAINQFYMDDFTGINSEQAHAMMCAWDYAILASNHFNRARNSYSRIFYARLIALFILVNNRVMLNVIQWAGAEKDDRHPIENLEHWKEIESFYSTTKSQLLAAGMTSGIA
ncbi:hypothetical protein KFK14_22595 [Sphingobium phenoxybenzoativorans]|uniref:Uncharacterized protein n=1 Tax=Sphingobium phenoxybenzoativorans TaxID=1592790 RepID=A0A975K6H8_9SPHN|nr:hypothetical protein [Sphingobium phenoxybenzoativorans]QUT05701.1 hypothetical protein KFK14_22595 [Sphingobium phenoxybenzoativorans]